MDTKIIEIKNTDDIYEKIKPAADIIKAGGLVAFPTETVYGLGANALDKEAAKKIYEAKGRPGDNPLIAHISSVGDMELLARDIPKEAYILAESFWPGPMTMVLRKKDIVPLETSGGLNTIAIRLPASKTARALIELSKTPIAAPSANISGRPSPTRAAHVIEDMSGRIDMIISAEDVEIGLESTIIDMSDGKITILRPGYITKEMIEAVIGKGRVEFDKAVLQKPDKDIVPKAPGMKYRHYAPKAQMNIVTGDINKVIDYINKRLEEDIENKKNVGIVCTDETIGAYPLGIKKIIGNRKDEGSIAHNMFAILREFDALDVDIIYSEGFETEGLGYAIMNRLNKAAGYNIKKLD